MPGLPWVKRMISGPCLGRSSAFGKLVFFTRARLAVFFALNHSGIPGEESGFLENWAKVGIHLRQSLGDAKFESAGLTGQTSAKNGGVNVIRTQRIGDHERLFHNHVRGIPRKICGEIFIVDCDFSLSSRQPYFCDGYFSPASGVNFFFCARH